MEENQTQPPQPTVENNEQFKSEQKSFNLKNKWPFLVIAVLLVLLGAFGAYFLGKNNASNQVSQAPTPTTIPAEDETANWKTYTSPSGYSFKYPTDWQVEYDPTHTGVKGLIISNYPPGKYMTIASAEIPYEPGDYLIGVGESENQGFVTPRGLIGALESSPYTERVKNQNEIKINNYDALYREESYSKNLPDKNEYTPYKPVVYLLDGKGRIIVISGDERDPNTKLFNQILSTFKFTQ